jgi:two-component system, NtrC family, nitrogen regulation response regulator NtrX
LTNSSLMGILLIIDPDPEFHKSLEWLQGQFGIKILAAASLSEGIHLIKQHPVDLVVMDMFLPQKSGLSLISEITSVENHPPIIATFSSEHAPLINVKKFAHMLGVTHTFEKPLNIKLFQQAFLELVPDMYQRRYGENRRESSIGESS